jgi:hypothetical protein
LVEFKAIVRPDTATCDAYEALLENSFADFASSIAQAARSFPFAAAVRDNVVEQLEAIQLEDVKFAQKMQPRYWAHSRFFNTLK